MVSPLPIQDLPLNFLVNFGMKNENTNRAMGKKTLNETSSAQLPEAQTSLSVPMKNVNIVEHKSGEAKKAKGRNHRIGFTLLSCGINRISQKFLD
jgi:hypothetical protein